MQTIFISSTFQDMQQERDILQNNVLPKIKELAKRYGQTIELCDLRWGIDSSELNESENVAKILQVCFDEIDHSRPFFIGLLGERYGWIPPSSLVKSILLNQERNIPNNEKKSMTELEILYGAFANRSDESDCRFYFRNISNSKMGFFSKPKLPEIYRAQNFSDKYKMQTLKEKIKHKNPSWYKSYTVSWNNEHKNFDGMDAFAEMVYNDLKTLLLKRWNIKKELTKYEKQFNQYQYALESDYFGYAEMSNSLNIPKVYKEMLLSGTWLSHKQNLLLIASDQYSLNRLVAFLYFYYQTFGYRVIPYDCGQSILSGTLGNLLAYFTYVCNMPEETARETKKTAQTQATELQSENILVKTKKFYKMLEKFDQNGIKTIFLIRGINHLERKDITQWLPSCSYKNIRFLISGNEVPVGTEEFQKNTEYTYFQTSEIFSADKWIDVYMKRYHKQLDAKSKATLIAKSAGKHIQYLEFLLQSLLILDQRDFTQINVNGGGIDAISQHLCYILNQQPNSLEELIFNQLRSIEREIGTKFTHALLGILFSVPFGIPGECADEILKCNKIRFSRLDLTMFCRMTVSFVNVNSDGNMRLTDSPVVELLRKQTVVDIYKWRKKLAEYMTSELKNPLCNPPVVDFLKLQYLQTAYLTDYSQCFQNYLERFASDPYYVSSVIHKLITQPGADKWVASEMVYLKAREFDFCLHSLYPIFKRNGWIDKPILYVWEALYSSILKKCKEKDTREEMKLLFFSSFQCGEMAFLTNQETAESYLLIAKEYSKKAFSKNPNRIWKVIHGIALSDEEKRTDSEILNSLGINIDIGNVQLGYGTELQDAVSEYAFSDFVRIINNYLSKIYKHSGEVEKEEQLVEEAKSLTHILDPNPCDEAEAEVVPGISMLLPTAADGDKVTKRAYAPDYRRNTAIQIAKKGITLDKRGEYRAAIDKFNKSNSILFEIYEDGETGENYDFRNVIGDIDEITKHIRSECLRDLALNYEGMLGCALKLKSENEAKRYIAKMLQYGEMFDSARNSAESKTDLEKYYAKAALTYYQMIPIDYEACLNFCAKFYKYYEEAFAKGHKKSDYDYNLRKQINAVFYQSLTHKPQMGGKAVDIIHTESNTSAIQNDFYGYRDYTYLAADLLDWMWANSYNWIGSQVSLEELYIHNICNLCTLWDKNQMWENLKTDADHLNLQLDNLKSERITVEAVNAILLYGLYEFRMGNYEKALVFFEHIVKHLRLLGTEHFSLLYLISHQNRYVCALSESGKLNEANKEAYEWEHLISLAKRKGHTQREQALNINKEDFEPILSKELCSAYINHAIILSRMGKNAKAEQYLKMADACAVKYKEYIGALPDMIKRIQFFRKNGLPHNKKENNPEAVYRKLKEKIETALKECMDAPHMITHEKLELITGNLIELQRIPEHEIFSSSSDMALCYYKLYMLFHYIGAFQEASNSLFTAKKYADEGKDAPINLYGMIYSDLCAVVESKAERLQYAHTAVSIYEALQRAGKNYSHNDLAMAYRNYGLVLSSVGNFGEAKTYVEKAISIWEELNKQEASKQIDKYINDSAMLLLNIMNNIKK